ncbi:aldehyde dehydrogenase family 3 member H1-like [Syzygium oleosum]|uniref:aldehyde dehydrogenase family 3 member H1-like n=1 Tax=Syzygium oleosum TaxID=219896 RepID=UPI0024B9683B|nr:aldehyde dehydrogenase family 3 member H1-like [Syzygium oleosum]
MRRTPKKWGVAKWTPFEETMVQTSLTTFPSSAEIASELLEVILINSAWNYPYLLSLDPVVGAIAAGNAVVLKPSEIAPATSALLAKLLGEYMDSSSIRVVEGAVAETTALLEQKWDKIFYTGNGRVGQIVMAAAAAAAAKRLTPVVLEPGGKAPVVVDSGRQFTKTQVILFPPPHLPYCHQPKIAVAFRRHLSSRSHTASLHCAVARHLRVP